MIFASYSERTKRLTVTGGGRPLRASCTSRRLLRCAVNNHGYSATRGSWKKHGELWIARLTRKKSNV